MKLRYYAAVVTGVLTGMLAFGYAWMFTKADAIEIMFIMLMAYMLGIFGTLAATEPRRKKKKPLGKPPVVTLDKEEWEGGKTA